MCLNFFIRFSLARIFFYTSSPPLLSLHLNFSNGLSLILRFYPLAENNQREESCETKTFQCTAQNTINNNNNHNNNINNIMSMHRSKYYLTVSGNLRLIAPLPLRKRRERSRLRTQAMFLEENWWEKLSDEQPANLQT